MGQSLSSAAFERTRDGILLALRGHCGAADKSLLSVAAEICGREDPDKNGWIPSSCLDTVVADLGLAGRWTRFEIDAFARLLVVDDALEFDEIGPRTSTRLDYQLFLEVVFFPIPMANARSSLQLSQQAVVDTGRFIIYEGEYNGRPATVREFKMGVDADEKETVECIRWNLNILRLAVHRNLVRYTTTLEAKRSLYIVEELYSSCSLRTILESFGQMKEATIRRYATQILEAVLYLHRHDVSLMNLRLENIHINSSGLVKLSNYGVRLNEVLCGKHETNPLSVDWLQEFQAPERLKSGESDKGTKASDVWSLGILLLVMPYGVGRDAEEAVSGGTRSGGKPGRSVARATGAGAGVPPIPSSMSKNLRAVVQKCLLQNPRARASVHQLREMDFFRVDQGSSEILREVCLDLDASIQRLTASTKNGTGNQSARSAARQSFAKSSRAPSTARTPGSLASRLS